MREGSRPNFPCRTRTPVLFEPAEQLHGANKSGLVEGMRGLGFGLLQDFRTLGPWFEPVSNTVSLTTRAVQTFGM